MLNIRNVDYPIQPPFRNPHIQGIIGSGWLRRLALRRATQKLQAMQQQLILSWNNVRLMGYLDRHRPNPRGLVVLLHGWEGSAESTYIISAAATCTGAGYDTFRLNLRDHGPTHHLNRDLFNSTLTAEVTHAIKQVRERYPGIPCHLAGFSLGGSFALRIAADNGDRLRLNSIVAICPPVNPANAMAALNARSRTYGAYFFQKWKKSLATKLHHFPDLAYGEALNRSRNLDQLNDFFVPGHTPFATPERYFAAYTVTGTRLAALTVPAWLITTRDDPVTPCQDISSIDGSVNLNVEIAKRGGHCGFLQNYRLETWIDNRLLQIFDTVDGESGRP